MKIFIIEDHPIMRQTLSSFIEHRSGFEVCGLAATAAEAFERLAEVEVDLVIIDVRLAGMNGLHLLEQLREKYPHLLYLILSGHGETIYIQHAFRAGARGYVLKGKPPELLEAIQTVAAGGTYLSPVLRPKLAEVENPETSHDTMK
jgi:DNA-binding NarL/FixJ family response regulator